MTVKPSREVTLEAARRYIARSDLAIQELIKFARKVRAEHPDECEEAVIATLAKFLHFRADPHMVNVMLATIASREAEKDSE